jgi:hypothetical protein
MKIANWNDLAKAIETLTPEQRKRPVIFLEGYDDWDICEITALTVAEETFENKEGEKVRKGHAYAE